MEITFLGGANEIGASCAIVDIAGGSAGADPIRLLVDCGQRLGHLPGELLPDFSALEGGPPIRAVLLTHAHIDHIGALPALEPYLPADCPVLGTAATLALAKVMLQDSVKSSVLYRSGPGQLPLYASSAAPGVMRRFTTVRWGREVKLDPSGQIRGQWYPSGHILGAALVEIKSPHESVLFSGDLSIADQTSVTGAWVPAIEPDALVLESTYGNRLHSHRPLQEQRIIERVRTVLSEGGSVLFPTFALGRAQEVLLILGRAMREGQLPKVPMWSDGMVRAIANVYSQFAEDLAPFPRRLAEQGRHPVFPDDLPIRPVGDGSQRNLIASGGPCVVVASGGMLQGGASQFYARHWLSGPKNLIAVTGYQDEESPGHALLKLANEDSDTPRYFEFDGIRTLVRCRIGSYSLSAHADNGELVAVASKLKPKTVYLVHGDDDAREGLAESLRSLLSVEVILPRTGDSYRFSGRARVAGPDRNRPNWQQPVDLLALWPPWDPYVARELDVAQIHNWVAKLRPRLKTVTTEELAAVWRSPQVPTDDDCRTVRDAIRQQELPYFVIDARRPELLHVTPTENLVARPDRMSEAETLAVARELFPVESGLRRIGVFPEEGVVQLTFDFPRAIEKTQPDRLRDLTLRTGWRWELSGQVREDHVATMLTAWLNSDGDGRTAGRPLDGRLTEQLRLRIDHSRELVTMRLPASFDFDQIDPKELAGRFARRTGYRLAIEGIETNGI